MAFFTSTYLIRVLHLLSSMFVTTTIIFNSLFDIQSYDGFDNKWYKQFTSIAGVIMIFSGIILVRCMKRKVSS